MVECSSSCAGMRTTSHRARGRRPNQSGTASFARARASTAACVDLVGRREPEGRVVPEAGDALGERPGAEDAPGQGDELGVDALDLRQAERVDVRRLEVERGVDADGHPIGGVAAREVPDARAIRGTGGRAGSRRRGRRAARRTRGGRRRPRRPRSAGREPLAVGGRPGLEVVEGRERLEQRPVVVGRREDAVEDADRSAPRAPRRRPGRPRGSPAGSRHRRASRRPSRASGRPSPRRPPATGRPGTRGR